MSATNRFELISENPIYHKARRMSPPHYEIGGKEVDRVLSVGVINTVESS